jgi:sortase A
VRLTGHRTIAIFFDLDRLRTGDDIIVGTGGAAFVYKVTNVVVVAPTAVEVVKPLPPGERAGRPLTLTTCNPKFNNYQRLIVHASMES